MGSLKKAGEGVSNIYNDAKRKIDSKLKSDYKIPGKPYKPTNKTGYEGRY